MVADLRLEKPAISIENLHSQVSPTVSAVPRVKRRLHYNTLASIKKLESDCLPEDTPLAFPPLFVVNLHHGSNTYPAVEQVTSHILR